MYLERLYPEPYTLITIQNRDTIAALVAAGDDLSIPREVEHYLFFQTPTALERFANSMADHGYSIKEHLNDDESDYAYGVTLVKMECITPEQVEESTSMLFELVLQDHGRYEGWSTVMGGEQHGVE
jgi:regulator of RNase E activity RraB